MQGPQGYGGPQGYIGAQPKGTTGDRGPQGYTGPQGPKGTASSSRGANGATGPQGYTGNTGYTGTAPRGENGSQGPQGYAGNTGSTGTANSTRGANGATGPQGYAGNNGPTGTTGDRGPNGSTGPQGFKGAKGSTGTTGDRGPNGSTGPQGFKGAKGPTGTTGGRGGNGSGGPQGYAGGTGPTGTTGGRGATGSGGPQGYAGLQQSSTASQSTAYGQGSATSYLTQNNSKAWLLGHASSSGGWTGTMYVGGNGSAGVWFNGGNLYASSDERLKNIKGEVKVDLNRLLELRKVYYTLKNDEKQELQIGTIAQDVQKIYPEVVDVQKDGSLAVSYSRLNIIALSAIDELKKRIDILENLVDE